MSGREPKRTPEERRILRWMARSRGWEYVMKNEELILAQARKNGDLPDEDTE